MLDTTLREVADGRPTVERVVSLIGFGGDQTGNCLIACSNRLACKLASAMLMQEYPAVNKEVMVAFGEISNMVFGNVKTDLEEQLGHYSLRCLPSSLVRDSISVPCRIRHGSLSDLPFRREKKSTSGCA